LALVQPLNMVPSVAAAARTVSSPRLLESPEIEAVEDLALASGRPAGVALVPREEGASV
jgi:hypothetical protein